MCSGARYIAIQMCSAHCHATSPTIATRSGPRALAALADEDSGRARASKHLPAAALDAAALDAHFRTILAAPSHVPRRQTMDGAKKHGVRTVYTSFVWYQLLIRILV